MNLEGGAPGCTWVDGGTYLIYRRCPVVGGKSLIQGKGHTHTHTHTHTHRNNHHHHEKVF